jgi:hypothetical protein
MEAPQEGLSGRGHRAAAGIAQYTLSCAGFHCPLVTDPETRSSVSTASSGAAMGCPEAASPTPQEGQLQLTEQLESWLRIAWKGKFAVMSPKLLLSTVWRLLPHFRGFKQQDAHEALVAIEDEWQNELAAVSVRSSA